MSERPFWKINPDIGKKSKTRGMSKRHFWKKNPTKFLKSGFRGMSKRPFWKKNPDHDHGYLPINFQNSLFPGNE